jgi:uncharacterized protein YndB with AHSA1/START domain
MHEIHDTAEVTLPVDPAALFATITDVEHLPEWNAAIERVVEPPPAMVPGARWTVEMHPMRGVRWKSVSTLDVLDVDRRQFSYRTVNADGNPSFSLWDWHVRPAREGATVSVRWDVFLKTADRRLFGGPIRRRQLRREVPASLRRVAEHVSI